jgi:hypothetical protein
MAIESYESQKNDGKGKTCSECGVTNRFVTCYAWLVGYADKPLCPDCRDEIAEEEPD